MSFLDKRAPTTEIFDSVSKKVQRMIIMLDIVLYLNAKKIEPASGHYFKLLSERGYMEGSIKKYLDETPEAVCSVCQKGAMMLSLVSRKNRLKWEEYGEFSCGFSKEFNQLKKYFGEDQLHALEHAYEGDVVFNYTDKAPEHLEDGVRVWSHRMYNLNVHPNTEKRMLQICYNVISNYGDFNPEVLLIKWSLRTARKYVENAIALDLAKNQ